MSFLSAIVSGILYWMYHPWAYLSPPCVPPLTPSLIASLIVSDRDSFLPRVCLSNTNPSWLWAAFGAVSCLTTWGLLPYCSSYSSHPKTVTTCVPELMVMMVPTVWIRILQTISINLWRLILCGLTSDPAGTTPTLLDSFQLWPNMGLLHFSCY